MTDKEREALVERLAEIIRLAHPGNAYGVDGAQKIARAALAEAMRDFSMLRCDNHDHPHDCPDVLVVWSSNHGAGLPVRDGGSSFCTIKFCPWCGTKIDLSQ